MLFEGESPLYFQLARHANRQAQTITDALLTKGYPFYAPYEGTNQVFPIVTKEKLAALEAQFAFNIEKPLDDGRYAIRFVTSFATTDEMVDALVNAL